ncbi:hypothetical protein AGLY_001747 [Aphis glycines]|uniref:Uncharacterized protein n=1 Tax=Aphis glycines TaxID=307491 RepID=A0A6G0U4L6_APHGL|nr:hypothetical protein AGLY_001747 [Aphis glycines]
MNLRPIYKIISTHYYYCEVAPNTLHYIKTYYIDIYFINILYIHLYLKTYKFAHLFRLIIWIPFDDENIVTIERPTTLHVQWYVVMVEFAHWLMVERTCCRHNAKCVGTFRSVHVFQHGCFFWILLSFFTVRHKPTQMTNRLKPEKTQIDAKATLRAALSVDCHCYYNRNLVTLPLLIDALSPDNAWVRYAVVGRYTYTLTKDLSDYELY